METLFALVVTLLAFLVLFAPRPADSLALVLAAPNGAPAAFGLVFSVGARREESETTRTPLAKGTRVRVVKGTESAPRVRKGEAGEILEVRELGPDYSYSVRVAIRFARGVRVFYARNRNRLAGAIVRLNDGRPENRIDVRALRADERAPGTARSVSGPNSDGAPSG